MTPSESHFIAIRMLYTQDTLDNGVLYSDSYCILSIQIKSNNLNNLAICYMLSIFNDGPNQGSFSMLIFNVDNIILLSMAYCKILL